MNVSKQKKEEKIYFIKDFCIFSFTAAGNTTAVAEIVAYKGH